MKEISLACFSASSAHNIRLVNSSQKEIFHNKRITENIERESIVKNYYLKEIEITIDLNLV